MTASGERKNRIRVLLQHPDKGGKRGWKGKPIIAEHDFYILSPCLLQSGIPVPDMPQTNRISLIKKGRFLSCLCHNPVAIIRCYPLHFVVPGVVRQNDFKVGIILLQNRIQQASYVHCLLITGNADRNLCLPSQISLSPRAPIHYPPICRIFLILRFTATSLSCAFFAFAIRRWRLSSSSFVSGFRIR